MTKLYAPHPQEVEDPGERRDATPDELADIKARIARTEYLKFRDSVRPSRNWILQMIDEYGRRKRGS